MNKRNWAIGMLGCVVPAIALIAWTLWNLQPRLHFVSSNYPVLAKPNLSKESLNDGSSFSFQLHFEQQSRETYAASVQNAAPDPSKAVESQQNDAFNALLLGVDADNAAGSRSDVILLVHFSPATKSVAIISVPRDTRVKLAGIGETKINHAHVVGHTKGGSKGGSEAVIQAVSDLFQVPIHYYAKTNFKGFQQFIDEAGGVDIEIPQDMLLSDSRLFLQAGLHHLDGKQALAFVRERYSLTNGDFGRQTDQMLLLKALAQKLVEPERLPGLPELIMKAKNEVIETNFSNSDLISLALLYKEMNHDQTSYLQIPGHSALEPDPLVGQTLWYWIPDRNAVQKITEQFLQH